MIARTELADALAADRPVAEAPVDDDPPKVTAKVPVAGSIVARWQEGATAQGLAPDYRRIVELLEGELPMAERG
ncbi:hypothetical protein [Streptomyces sp. NPDC006355]|uniref:hypothetical protein n=1 Tax=Streptomyces sp. NPDC006355 TaxID=3156758 RepID=UPI0033A8D151